tara:strand:+ start:1347 stop:1832 length:486 start_codon:yes stop_codon:yes gene_type:complete
MNIVYLQLGSNLGDRLQQLRKAIVEIEIRIGDIINFSKVYESLAWGVVGQPNYLNQILEVRTKFEAKDILSLALDIEDLLGRKRKEKWGERLIDIDILFYNSDIISSPALDIPHKHLHKRKFVLVPLNEIAKNYKHPKYMKKVKDLLLECDDKTTVHEYVL